MSNRNIVVRNLHETMMTVYRPDDSILVETDNLLCIHDILIQIDDLSLEGYKIKIENEIYNISKDGHIEKCMYEFLMDKQLRRLMGF